MLFPFQLIYAQIEHWKIEHPLQTITTLSGNYAELRRNHFHGGLDFRTGGMENQPVYSIDEGYVSHISISPRGYGKMAYIAHPNGYTSLYAHLNGFTPKLDSIVKARQYQKQSFEIDIILQPDEYPVKKGEQFAISGNTGSSGGPHLHFEIRKTEDHTLMNPMILNSCFKVEDRRKPRILAVKIYGLDNEGIINNVKERKFRAVNVAKTRTLQGGTNIKAWGKIGFAVRANDYMTGTHFTHNPRILKLYVDNVLISEANITNIKYGDTRAFNSFIDFRQFIKTGEFFMKSFPDTNSPLHIFSDTGHNGSIHITEERPYAVRYEVYDDFGLDDVVSFTIQGEKMKIPEEKKNKAYVCRLPCGKSQFFDRQDFLAYFPENALYTDLNLEYEKSESPKFYSSIHELGNTEIPLHSFCDITIKVTKDSLGGNMEKYFIAKLNANNIITGSAGGVFVNGFMVGKINAFGRFAVAKDQTRPIITAVNTTELYRRPYLRFRIFDGLSGIAKYDGYIDDEWVLFEYDTKSNAITYYMKNTGKLKKNRKFKLVVTDNCGNSSVYEKIIYW